VQIVTLKCFVCKAVGRTGAKRVLEDKERYLRGEEYKGEQVVYTKQCKRLHVIKKITNT
jgi:hypothetical protein